MQLRPRIGTAACDLCAAYVHRQRKERPKRDPSLLRTVALGHQQGQALDDLPRELRRQKQRATEPIKPALRFSGSDHPDAPFASVDEDDPWQ
jgi:hypothetical protein